MQGVGKKLYLDKGCNLSIELTVPSRHHQTEPQIAELEKRQRGYVGHGEEHVKNNTAGGPTVTFHDVNPAFLIPAPFPISVFHSLNLFEACNLMI
jgi:hypothetical protein